ncbi:hypothetical protein SODALDRAFT_334937 [Sodiomyces alkalinus F11]|uniref:F-box domain-containing protein n=1 Tax=Sodiomyces alkalinus (strain CBS 110278 / VKM F-3762 / F11) TaxID=1314773 RepID=A0A3N2PQK9_SODAK|nr:hypothetical protein SODALDRAFT_334937 [Sodiomyces alkalinus F11]ROT36740.1 hypothetical protein SODALDRAFT_334937 [Sodiomyces alkalinus F11]
MADHIVKLPECSADADESQESQDVQDHEPEKSTHYDPRNDQSQDEDEDDDDDDTNPSIPTSRPSPTPSAPLTDSDRVAVDGHLTIRSKRTERQRKRQQKRLAKKPTAHHSTDGIPLPNELLLVVLSYLRPSDLFILLRTSKFLRDTILDWETSLVKDIIDLRYPCLAQCIRLPRLLGDVDPALHPALLNPADGRHTMGTRKFHHIQPPDHAFICTCLTCVLHWIALCVVVDFAHWQPRLDAGDPLPTIPRGTSPEWNEVLLASHVGVVRNALASPLWYARLLEEHLRSTTRSIRRHAENKGNRRRRFEMTRRDELAGTDALLRRKGPATVDFPFHRDNYYMLEAYLPNRSWSSDQERWLYLPDLHERDLQWVAQYHARKREDENGGAGRTV